VLRTTIVGNRADRDGGAIRSYFRGDVEIVDSTIRNNTAGRNGGGLQLRIFGSAATILNSTVSGNTSGDLGGGIWIYGISASTRIAHSTITQNSTTRVSDKGGGIVVAAGVLNLDHSIVASNHAAVDSDITLQGESQLISRHSIVGANAHSGLLQTMPGTPDVNGNLVGGTGGQVIDAILGLLADNGGPTWTHALLPGSPAINAGDLNAVAGVDGVPLYDQRGEPFGRVVNGRIDIGAFEYQSPSDLNLLVDTLADESDGDHGRGDLSLREAINLANMWPSDDTIRFDPALTTSGPATILLAMGELSIRDDVSIIGPGADSLTIDARGNDPTPEEDNGDGSRVFNIDDGDDGKMLSISVSGLSFTGGDVSGRGGAIRVRENLTLADSTISANSAGLDGGGVSVDGALPVHPYFVPDLQLSVSTSTITGNRVSGFGGGISFFSYSGDLSVTASTVSDNWAGLGGGGINDGDVLLPDGSGRSGFDGATMLSDSIISGNIAGYYGGGISGNSVSVVGSRISNNTCGHLGGGIFGADFISGVKVVSSTISGNTADYAGGGICLLQGPLTVSDSTVSGNSAARGGGIFFSQHTAVLTVINSTVSGNSAMNNGGGIYLSDDARGPAIISHSTVFDNLAEGFGGGVFIYNGILRLDHTIIAGNNGGGPDLTGLIGATIDARFSLIGSNAGNGLREARVGAPDAKGNLIGGRATPINPRLAPLAANGGPTLTHSLLPTSPAIDIGDPNAVAGMNGVPLYDQRGVPYTRVHNGRIDIGSFERQPDPLPGDFNYDGSVSAADYVVWRKFLGMSHGNADANNNGIIDQSDGDIWAANFGSTMPVAATADVAVASATSEYGRAALRITTRPPQYNSALVRPGSPSRVTAAHINGGDNHQRALRIDLIAPTVHDVSRRELILEIKRASLSAEDWSEMEALDTAFEGLCDDASALQPLSTERG
jgi:CSLREA domain-containing protein